MPNDFLGPFSVYKKFPKLQVESCIVIASLTKRSHWSDKPKNLKTYVVISTIVIN